MAGYLSTHVLDTARGCPAQGVKIELFRLSETGDDLIRTLTSNADGRTDELVIPEDEFVFGSYQLSFSAGAYLASIDAYAESEALFDIIPITFKLTRHIHFHVPLLLSPYSYSTYLGS
ncbi:hydroxyisourate hydrolase [Loktanella sp. Alg231-35]|uniref:hydroxyisourate hydrolase n=1 Tax=Loktanella sp. Alg231-35 TaxID=1922220 RepID=UPI000D55D19B|nr:hydroxyisourate hydrolase [Loktanella sp. Alg231-35]